MTPIAYYPMDTKFTYHDSSLVAVNQTERGDLVFEVELCPGHDIRDGPATLMLHDIRNSRYARRGIEYLGRRLSSGIQDDFGGLCKGARERV